MANYDDAYKYKLIYIMSIDDDNHKGFLKIGEATIASSLGPMQITPNCEVLNKAARLRISGYTKTAFTDFDLLYTELALYYVTLSDGTRMPSPFSDKDIHDILSRSGFLCKRFPDTDRDSEWYAVNLSTAINAIKAFKEGRLNLSGSEKNNPSPAPGQNIHHKITLRQEQENAIIQTIQAFKSYDTMLWDCKMRFGKTLTSYELIKRANFQKTIVVTHRPVVVSGWQKDHDLIFGSDSNHLFVTKKINTSAYEFDPAIDSENERILNKYAHSDIFFTYFSSMQDLRGSKIAGGKWDKNNAVFNIDWDLIIYDEAHEGTQTDLGQTVRELLEMPKKGKKPKVLSLSGTPYNILGHYEENIYSWDYVMEQKRKREFASLYPDLHNPYADLPEMKIYTFDLADSMPTSYRYTTEDMAFNFREFFRTWTGKPEQDFRPLPTNASIGDFVHEEDVQSFLNLITTESKESYYPFSTAAYREMFRHTFWMVPGVKEARALSSLLKKHPIFKNFAIANVAGEGDQEENYEDALKKVQEIIKNHPYSITISCGRLTTGVTVPEWSAVMMLTGSSSTSATGYMQTIFRVQSVGSVNGKQKEVAYVFDFAPDRALNVLSEVHNISKTHAIENHNPKIALGEFLNFCPVIAINGTHMEKYDVPKMMRQIKKITVDKAIKSGFDDESIYKDGVGIIMDAADVKLFNKLASIIHGQKKSKLPSKVTINKQGLTGEEYNKAEKAKNKPLRERTPEELECIRKQQEMKKEQEKVICLLRAVSIRLPLLIYGAEVDLNEDIHINDFIALVDNESWTEFMPQNVTKSLFMELLKYYDEDVVVGAGLRIRRMTKAADELPPTLRVQRIAEIFSFFRNPDKETVLTPWRVVNMHLGDILGGYNFYNENYTFDGILDKPRLIDNGDITTNVFLKDDVNILEMNSKSGLYPLYIAYTLYALKLSKPENQLSLNETLLIWREILEKNIFVLCKTKMALSITKRTLAGYHNDWTIRASHLSRLLDRMKDKARLGRKLTNPNTWGKEGTKLKFDAIVGNPPYQLNDGGGTGSSAVPIYQNFVQQAKILNPRYISMIMPSRWFTGGRGLDAFRDEMLHDNSIRIIHDFPHATDCFPTVDIKGGICYILWDRDCKGTCEVYTHNNVQITSAVERPLLEKGMTTFVRSNGIINILRKVLATGENSFSDMISPNDPFGFDIRENNSYKRVKADFELSPFSDCVKLYYNGWRKDGVGYIAKSRIRKNIELIDKVKIFIPKAWGTGNVATDWLNPFIPDSHSCCTETYLVVGPFDNVKTANNVISYIHTRFFHAMLSVVKLTQNTMQQSYSKIPIQDFSKPWTDEDLYEKYNLTNDEICFLNTTFKPE